MDEQARGTVVEAADPCDDRLATTPVEGHPPWTARSGSGRPVTIELDGRVLAELDRVVEDWRAHPVPALLVSPEQHELPACRELMGRVRTELDDRTGLTVLSRLPVDGYTVAESTGLAWLLGRMLAPPVATKWDGTVFYDVRDSGRRFGPGVRGSSTSAELTFHTDNAFGAAVPDYVGLLCLRPARAGGVSRFCSLAEVHGRLAARAPHLLARLYRPVLFDRQAEHADGAAPVLSAPVFGRRAGRLRTRLVPGLVRRGYAAAGREMDAELVQALDLLEEVLREPDLAVEFRMERGQLQFLHNHGCAHYRSAFSDPEGSPGRHLVRMWFREGGRPSYDG